MIKKPPRKGRFCVYVLCDPTGKSAVTGQAAGIAAAMTDVFSAMDGSLLQQKLRKNGIVIREKDPAE